jgi:hypothetical protein
MRPVRWAFDNLATLCSGCNYRHEFDRTPMTYYMVARLGERGFADLAELAHSHRKFTYTELVELYEERKAEYQELKKAVA